ncbi:hypothetical protein FQN60_001910 [Etheostoma spectabile]|uniref:Uncharacterized protein n=1 Tax=Etheostoma spectabile TaxID=54343 RepID=A0A5J5D9X2_9PERO|nr:hypothetical protein FQN60_001910 [Etheostoma spectabile]
MTSNLKRKEESQLLNGDVKQPTWSKAFNSTAVWEEKVSHLFCIINAGVLYVYFSSFQQIDEEEYGGTWELTKEGFMTSFALFLVVWIIFYTALHFD